MLKMLIYKQINNFNSQTQVIYFFRLFMTFIILIEEFIIYMSFIYKIYIEKKHSKIINKGYKK